MADGLRKIAKALYKRGSGEEKKEVVEFLSKLDIVPDEEVSVQEFKKKECVESPDEEVLKELSSKRDGNLDFYDVLVVFYHSKNAITILRCDACRLLIFGPSFSCSECFSSGDCSSHTLCCDCYGAGKAIHHDHPARFLHDHHLLGLRLNHPAKVSSQAQNRKEIESAISVARAYYERSSDDGKEGVREFFREYDANGDGNISLTELKTQLKTNEAEEVIRMFDSNSDGVLNFDEMLVLFYTVVGVLRHFSCDGCKEPLWGSFFSCAQCVIRVPRTFDLCFDCYRGGKVEHEHSYSDCVLHSNTILLQLMQTRAEGEMGELRKIAGLYIDEANPEVARAAREFFDSMDSNGDGKVDVDEFMSFMSEQQGCQQLRRNTKIFVSLDSDGSGALDFSEAMLLFYVIKSGRPHCDGCSAFIPGTFFACPRCSYTLCRPCYESKDHPHVHDGSAALLLDNYALLQYLRQSAQPSVEPHSSSIQPAPASSRMIVVAPASAPTRRKREVAYKSLEMALAVKTACVLAGVSCVIS